MAVRSAGKAPFMFWGCGRTPNTLGAVSLTEIIETSPDVVMAEPADLCPLVGSHGGLTY